MKNYNFRPIFHNFTENCVKNVSNFWRKFGENLEVFIYRGFAFGARDFIKNGQKAMEISYFWKFCINYQRKFDFHKLI